MTDFDDDFDDTADETAADESNGLKALRTAARDGKRAKADAETARAEALAARREIAFLKAGIDPDSQTAKRISKVHDGELTAEALKATAVEYGWAEQEAPEVPAEELRQVGQFAATGAGGNTNATTGEELTETLKSLQANWQPGKAAEGVAAVMKMLSDQGIPVSDNAFTPRPDLAVGNVQPFGSR